MINKLKILLNKFQTKNNLKIMDNSNEVKTPSGFYVFFIHPVTHNLCIQTPEKFGSFEAAQNYCSQHEKDLHILGAY